MVDFYGTLLATVLNILIPYLITRHDRKKLSPVELARAWNTPSWACALYFFGPLCLPAHFWVTRRTLTGLFQGAFWGAVILAGEMLLATAMDRAIGTPT